MSLKQVHLSAIDRPSPAKGLFLYNQSRKRKTGTTVHTPKTARGPYQTRSRHARAILIHLITQQRSVALDPHMSLIIARPERTRLVMGTHGHTRSLTSGANAAHHLLLKPRKANKSPGTRPRTLVMCDFDSPGARRGAATQVISTIHYSGNLLRDPTTTSLVLMLLLLVRGQILAHLLASLGKARSSLAYDGSIRRREPNHLHVRQSVRRGVAACANCAGQIFPKELLPACCCCSIGVDPRTIISHHHQHHLMRE